MIAYLILSVCLLAALLLAGRWFVSANPRLLANLLRYGSVGLFGMLAVFLMITGRFGLGLLPAAIAFAIWRGMRGQGFGIPFGGFGGRTGSGRASPGRTSDVETAYLRMVLDHDTGTMSGTVLRGDHAGRDLSDLNLQQLIELAIECEEEDPQSAQLLETFLDRVHGPEWRDAAQAGSGGGRSRSGGAMTIEEAREILGVESGASAEEIRAAHHRQMLKNHPDRGGSSYLAAKINEAKDLLLRS